MPLTPGGQLAGLARVSFEAVTGEFNADVQHSEQVYRDATRGMSDDSIRLELSQERLRRELAKGPANYRAIARAELEVRRSEQALRGENARLERQFDETRRSADRMGRGMLAGSGALRGLGRNLAFASAGFLGGTGLIYGMRTAINAASNLEEQTNKVRVVFGSSSDEVVRWSTTTATSIGIASDQALEAAGSYGNMFQAMGLAEDQSAKWSRTLVQLAADMASFNNEDPTAMLDRIRSGLAGEVEPLRKFGATLSAARVQQFAWANGIAKSGEELDDHQKLLARYGLLLKDTAIQQGDYARTSDSLANSQRTLSALWREANILVGQALAPTYTDLVRGVKDWLAVEENRRDLQREVNDIVRDADKVARGFVEALKLIKDVADPVVDAVGGIGNAVKIATLLWVGFKVKAIVGFAATAVASKTTATSMIIDARMVDAAWTTATRPRVMPVTVVPTGAPGTGGFLGRLGRSGLGKGLLGTALVVGGVQALAPGEQGTDLSDQPSGAGSLTPVYQEGFGWIDPVSGRAVSDQRYWDKLVAGGFYNPRTGKREKPSKADQRAAVQRMAADAAGKPTRRPQGGRRGRFTVAQFDAQQAALQERAIDAASRPGEAEDVAIAREELTLIRRALSELELTRDQRVALKNRRNTLLSQIASVEQQADQEAAARREEAAAKRRQANEERKQAIRDRIARREGRLTLAEEIAGDTERDLTDDKRALIRLRKFYGEQAQNDKLTLAERQEFASKRRAVRRRLRDLYREAVDDAIADDKLTKKERQRLRQLGGADLVRRAERGLAGSKKDTGDDDKALTAGEIAAMHYQFITGLHGVLNQFGGNAGDSAADFGMMGTQSQLQTLELSRQTRILEEFTGATRHPMTGYHKTEGTALLMGYGF